MLSGCLLTPPHQRFKSSLNRCLLAAIFLLLWMPRGEAAGDIPGSADPSSLERYPLSYIVEYQQRHDPEYWLALGPMKKVNGVIGPETSDAVSGNLTRITYRVPDGHDSGAAFTHIARQLKAQGYASLYECSGRRCGSSNEWANSQFGIAQLYGVDRDQYYGAYRSRSGEQSVALYSVRRGNKRIYLHLDLIGSDSPNQSQVPPVAQQLRNDERLFVELGDPLESLAAGLTVTFRQNPELRVRLVGHSRRGENSAARVSASQVDAERVMDRLILLGVPSARLSAQGVGDLAPAYDRSVPLERVELVAE